MQAQPQRQRANNQQAGGQLCERNSRIAVNILGPQQISQSGDPAKGLRTPREFNFKGRWDLIAELTWDWGNKSLGEHKPNFVHTRTWGKEQ